MELLNTKLKTEAKEMKDLYRVVISKEAKQALDDLLKRANEGFDAGEISKSDIVNSLLLNSTKYFSDSEIRSLRSQHFDEAKALDTLQKDIAQGKALPETLKAFLRGQYGLADSPKKRATSAASNRADVALSLVEGEDGSR